MSSNNRLTIYSLSIFCLYDAILLRLLQVRELEMILSEHMSRAYTQSKTQGQPVDNLAFNVRIIKVDLPEIQEVNTEAIAKEKALLAAQLAGGPCLVEDTSLQFHALGGMPGPYIKWFQDTLKSEGLYNILMAYSDKSATACCTLAFCPAPHADPVLFTGKTVGTIVAPVAGGGGFGWDSIFVPNGSTVPFASMTTEQKNELSHRGKAVRQWAQWVSANRQELFERQQGRPAIGHKGLDFKCISPEQ
jgi:inosine triphosphate pyrophosphatase